MAMRMLFRGELIPVPTVETALAFLAQESAQASAQASGHAIPIAGARPRRRILGSPDTVRAKIDALVDEYRADEVMVVTITHDHIARRRSYELLAAAFSL